MNKNLIIGVVVVLLGAAIGGYYFMNHSMAPAGNTAMTGSENSSENNVIDSSVTSLRNLMQSSANRTCTFQDEDGNSGEVYVASGKMRGDFRSSAEGELMSSHMISDGRDIYMWMDNSSEGFKMSYDSTEKIAKSVESESGNFQSSVDLDQEVDYSCSAWSVDQSKFSLPAGIEFADYSAMMEDAANMMTNEGDGMMIQDKNSQCSACDSLRDDAKSQCRAALKCN